MKYIYYLFIYLFIGISITELNDYKQLIIYILIN